MNNAIRLTQPSKEPSYVRKNEGLPLRGSARPADRFVYMHYPKRWEYNAEHGFLPTLAKIIAKPGINGIGKNGDLTPALVVAQQNGGTYIDPQDKRLGDFIDYVQYYTCENGAKWWVDSCMVATVLPGGQINWNSKPGEWDGFRKQLRDAGIVEPLMPEVYELMIKKQQNKIDRRAAKAGMNPIYQQKYQEAVDQLEAMRGEWARMTEVKLAAVKSKPKAKRPRKGKAIDIVKGDEA